MRLTRPRSVAPNRRSNVRSAERGRGRCLRCKVESADKTTVSRTPKRARRTLPIAPKKLPKRLTREEAAALLAQPNRRYPTGIRDRALIRLMYRAGLRCSEGLDLRVRDVQLERRELRVNAGKGDKDRVVWFDEATVELLQRWKDIRPKSDWFFCTLAGGRLRDSNVREMFARRGRKAGIEIRVHPHLCRHTYASELLEDGYSLLEVQRLLGHERLETTAIYVHLADERLRQRLIARA